MPEAAPTISATRASTTGRESAKGTKSGGEVAEKWRSSGGAAAERELQLLPKAAEQPARRQVEQRAANREDCTDDNR